VSQPTPASVPDGDSNAVEAALADAERKGFRLAVLGWAGALIAIAVFYFVTISGALALLKAHIGLPSGHALRDRMQELFLPVCPVEATSV
jgi:hypothetical protein